MTYRNRFASGLLWLAVVPALAQTAGAPPASPSRLEKHFKATIPAATREDDGQRVFAQNCSRCHTAPESFPPSISGTIVRHMRVRASLSKQDEQALLHFLNP
jgi:mono/diheme cytochrome c family protein